MFGADKLESKSGTYVLCNECDTRIPTEYDACPVCGSHDINRSKVYDSLTDDGHNIVDQYLICYLGDMGDEKK